MMNKLLFFFFLLLSGINSLYAQDKKVYLPKGERHPIRNGDYLQINRPH